MVGVVALTAQAALLRKSSEPLLEDHARLLAAQVRHAREVLRHADPLDRSALARRLSDPGMRIERRQGLQDQPLVALGAATGTSLAGAALEPLGRLGEAALRNLLPTAAPVDHELAEEPRPEGMPAIALHVLMAELGPGTRVGLGEPGRLLVDFEVGGEPWRIDRRLPRRPQELLDTVLAGVLLLGLAMLAAIMGGLHWIERPITRLAERIAQHRGRLQPLMPDPRASREIRQVEAAFNALVHADAMAASLRQQLLAGVSHDLRTPLARLRLRIETQCDEPLAQALETDLRALQQIVDQFLAYVQGEGGPLPGAQRPVAEALQALVAERQAPGEDVQLDLDPAAEGQDGPRWPGLAWRRVLDNLVGNALAHGQAPVRLSLRAEPAHWCLSVEDAGPGLSLAAFEQARQPFVRLDEARASLGHCGLGLAIVDQLAAAQAAVVSVRPRSAALAFAVQVRWPREADPRPRRARDHAGLGRSDRVQ
jgi:two-component system, OmpR family, osmolarity sensor histidine kinase EnvZ